MLIVSFITISGLLRSHGSLTKVFVPTVTVFHYGKASGLNSSALLQ